MSNNSTVFLKVLFFVFNFELSSIIYHYSMDLEIRKQI